MADALCFFFFILDLPLPPAPARPVEVRLPAPNERVEDATDDEAMLPAPSSSSPSVAFPSSCSKSRLSFELGLGGDGAEEDAPEADGGEPKPPPPRPRLGVPLLRPYPTARPLAGLLRRTGDPTTRAEDESTPSKSNGSDIALAKLLATAGQIWHLATSDPARLFPAQTKLNDVLSSPRLFVWPFSRAH